MPAIQIERLKAQIKAILNPALPAGVFVLSLRSFMEAHTNLAYRISPELHQKQQVESYQIAPVIQNQLTLNIQLFTREYPQIAMDYADLLWQEPFIEMKALAGEILGTLPEQFSQQVLSKIVFWSDDNKIKAIRKIIFETSTKSIRNRNISDWQYTIKKWLDSGEVSQIQAGIHALIVLVQDQQYDNYPFIFKSISLVSLKRGEKTVNALNDLLLELAQENPNETFVFLKSFMLSEPSPELFRLVRRSMSDFSNEQQSQFRQIMKV